MNNSGMLNVPTIALLPRIYRRLLTVSRRHGLFTLARLHHRCFKRGQIVRLPGGGRLFVPPDPHYFGFLCGIHEEHVRNVIDRYVQPGNVCLDVGANIGYFAMMMADRIGTLGKVYAFEPVPETYDVLSLNAMLAGDSALNLLPIHAAVSSNNGELSICRNAHSTLHQVSALVGSSAPASGRVTCTTLASALERLKCDVPISLLKVDVEGHELAVLTGALPLLRSGRIHRMIIEVTPGNDAAVIDSMLNDCRATVRCWLAGRWKLTALSQLSLRTDAFVEFSS